MSQPNPRDARTDTVRLLDQLAADQGAQAATSVDDLAGNLWESDEELAEFLEFVRQERQADLA